MMAIVVICILTLLTSYGIFVGYSCKKKLCDYDRCVLEVPEKEDCSEFKEMAKDVSFDLFCEGVSATKVAKAKSGAPTVTVQDMVRAKARPKEGQRRLLKRNEEEKNSDDDWGEEWPDPGYNRRMETTSSRKRPTLPPPPPPPAWLTRYNVGLKQPAPTTTAQKVEKAAIKVEETYNSYDDLRNNWDFPERSRLMETTSSRDQPSLLPPPPPPAWLTREKVSDEQRGDRKRFRPWQ